MGRLVITHSTYVEGLIPWLKVLARDPEIQTITPGVIARVRGHSSGLQLRVSIPVTGGFKVLARKGYYNVKYDDGDRESNVPTARLALVQSAEEDAVMRAPGKDKGAGTKRKAPVARGSNNGQKKQRKKG